MDWRHRPSYRRRTLLRRKTIMTEPVQLLLPLDVTEERTQLPADDEVEVVAAVASLLLQILTSEESKEVEDDL